MKKETEIKKLPKLTKQEEIFTDKVIETGNITKAVQESFGIKDQNYAGVKGNRLLRKDKIIEVINVKQESLREALLKQGVTPKKIARKVDQLLESDDDNSVDKGLKHATNIYGIDDFTEKPRQGNTYNFIFSEDVQKKVKEIDSHIKDLFTKDNVQEN